MKITLSNNKEIEILGINLRNSTVDFKDIDGVCTAPYVSVGDIPTEAELKTAIEAVLGEV
jgi:hypothetical protein